MLVLTSACWARENPEYMAVANDTGANGMTAGSATTATGGTTTSPPTPATTNSTKGPTTTDGPIDESTDEGVLPIDMGLPPTGECPPDMTCEPIPGGWLPVMIPPKDNNDLCPTGSDTFALLTTEPEFDCDCDCNETFGTCGLSWQLNTPGCDNLQVDNSGCGLTSGSLVEGNYYADLVAPPCSPDTFLVPVTPPRDQLVCQLNEVAPNCGDGNWCAPETAACLLAEGRHECPGEYGDREVMAGSWTPPSCDLECGGCNWDCGDVVMYPGGSCDNAPIAALPANAVCSPAPPGIIYYAIGYEVEPACQSAGIIEAPPTTTDSEYTLCCRG